MQLQAEDVSRLTQRLERPNWFSSGRFIMLLLVPALGTVLFGAVDAITWALFSILWALTVLFWIGDAWSGGGLMTGSSSLLLPVGALVSIGVLQLLPTPFRSLNPWATLFFDIRLLVLLTFFAGYLAMINNSSRLRKVVAFIIVFGAAMAFFGILQRLATPEGIYGLRKTPQAIPFGPFVNQHHFAAFMEMTGGLTRSEEHTSELQSH